MAASRGTPRHLWQDAHAETRVDQFEDAGNLIGLEMSFKAGASALPDV